MSVELHVWGPAFGLPSIDAPCLAAIAYLRECLPQGSWSLIAALDPLLHPLNELPAIRDGERWVSGFKAIVDYLRGVDKSWDLDSGLSSTEAADCIAYTAFLESRGQPLLDLSLYVSSENYSTRTSPALSKLLAWPSSWFVPHQLREKARKTSEHLGLRGLDVDSAHDEESDEGLSAQIPKSLKKPRQTVSSLLGHDTRRSKFRLDAVTSDFLEPLDELLGGGEWLITDHATSADCLALGYLALMHISGEVPQPWLRLALEDKFSNLGKWVQKRQKEWFPERQLRKTEEGASGTNPALPAIYTEHDLPWKVPARNPVTQVVNSFVLNAIQAIPLFKAGLRTLEASVEHRQNPSSRQKQKQKAIDRVRAQELWYSQLLGSSILVLVISGVLEYNGLLRIPSLRPRLSKTPRFGEAGAFLGLG